MPYKKLLMPTIVAALAAFVFLFIEPSVTRGILFGYVFSVIYLYHLIRDIDKMISGETSVALSQIVRMLFLCIPLVVSAFYPDVFHIIGAFAGLMIPKFCFYVSGFLRKG